MLVLASKTKDVSFVIRQKEETQGNTVEIYSITLLKDIHTNRTDYVILLNVPDTVIAYREPVIDLGKYI
ncbi:MAG TPA: hypothetical protein K8U96_04040 [Bacteroides fragilis]|nr:hypothetical protein [Bacteroides fragilis]MCS3169987.1 hypothetical protein [Bacteroides fragilis]UVS57090.1 hypothetical protein NXX16_17180 [Bacteroides fragilis]HJG69209.1 hypothetical protein [Bacteroides fragilis]